MRRRRPPRRRARRGSPDLRLSAIRFFDEADFCVGWSADDDPLRRSSHALGVDGRVYIVDPVDRNGVDERIRALGEPAAVLVLLDRHRRDADAFAARFGVPLHETPLEPVSPAPFEFRPIARSRFWREVALWWPERRVLAVGDALGTVGYFRAGDETLGVHPFLRLRPPREALAEFQAEHVLVGHGKGVHGPPAAMALERALAGARRNAPRLATSLVRRRA